MAEKHGIELFLKQNISEALGSAAKAAIETRGGLSKIGPAAASSFRMAGDGMTMLNQSLEVGKKAIEMFRATIGASIETSLQFRKEGDETVRFFKDMGRESQLVKARIGDALLPVIRGFTEALGETTGSISDWVAQNQRLIGTKLVEWIGSAAKVLTTGLANAVVLVAKAFLGWEAIIAGVQTAVNEMFAGLLSGVGKALAGIQAVAERFGRAGLASSIASARESVQGLGSEFSNSSEEAQRGLVETAAKIDQTEKAIRRVQASVTEVIERGMVKAQERVQSAITGTTRTIEEQTEAIQRQGEMIDAISERRIAAIEREAALREADARAQDAKMQASAGSGPMSAGDAGMSVAASAGAVGGVIQAGMQGGPWAAVAQVGIMAVQESEALQSMLADVTDMFSDIVEAFEPVFEAIRPITYLLTDSIGTALEAMRPALEMMGRMLTPLVTAIEPINQIFTQLNPAMLALQVATSILEPVFYGLAKVFRRVGLFVIDIGEGIANLWNGIVKAIGAVLKKLGNIKVFGKRPLGFLRDWGDGLIDSASIGKEAFDEARERIAGGMEDIADTMEEGAKDIDETVKEIANSSANLPGGIKLSYERFRAMEGLTTPMGSMMVGSGKTTAIGEKGVGGNVANFNGPINVYGVTDIDEMKRQIESETARDKVARWGSLAAVGSMP